MKNIKHNASSPMWEILKCHSAHFITLLHYSQSYISHQEVYNREENQRLAYYVFLMMEFEKQVSKGQPHKKKIFEYI